MTADLRPAETRILAAITGGRDDCPSVAKVIRAARGVGSARAAMASLVASGWLERWDSPCGKFRLVTLTPWAAERLDVALICPEKDERPEPSWGCAGATPGGPYDRPPSGCGRPRGLYAEEPVDFIVEDLWVDSEGTEIRRSLTRFDKIAVGRAADTPDPAAALMAAEPEPVRDQWGNVVTVGGEPVYSDMDVRAALKAKKRAKAAERKAAKAAKVKVRPAKVG